ncbi:hypothetical protein M9H77_32674 [Catharanthus roseus]|uniref:Uncharacterized protein n=1 Tax=Catharanthus roseus TaxID=4058 RepID=A0ACC0A6B0_CATRO|nr:hypothetical protein M9H77_32674 [Catharanthus roseus]
MGNRRLAQLATSDDEDDDRSLRRRSSPGNEQRTNERKRKKMKLDNEEEQGKEETARNNKRQKKKVVVDDEEEEEQVSEPEEEEEEEEEDPAKPIGDVIRVSGRGKGRRNHYDAFEYDGNRYDLEDPVLLVPEVQNQKPYVAIIKDISQKGDGSMMVTGQWFYRPEEAEKKGGGNWQSSDTRELFYSFHRDEVPAESVMHKCVVHFIPLNKQIPLRKQHPGFIVQKVYDTEQRRLFKLTDKDYEDNKQEEIDLLVQKTMSRVGDLPDIEPEDAAAVQEEQLRNKRLLRKKYMAPIDVSRADEAPSRSGQSLKVETPGSCANNASEYFVILSKFDVLTGETQRDKWLEKLLQGVQFVCTPNDGEQSDSKEKGSKDGSKNLNWPDTAVSAVAALEKASHEALSSDFQKYNQKMRQLSFNLAHNAVLARRVLSGELEPSQVLSMSPNELKEGLTAEEIASREPEESERMQMTDARCKRCKEKKVGIVEIIQAGHGDRYQLECTACGNSWYAPRDEVSTLTIDEPSSAKNVGTVPLATAKFEDVEKKLVSPRGSENSADDVLKKTTEAYVPVVDNQKQSQP